MAPSSPTPSFDTPDPADLARIRPPRRGRRWAIGLGVLALVAVGTTVALWPSDDDVAWQTGEVTEGALSLHVTAVGQLEPLDVVEVGSDLTGRLATVPVAKNQRVAAGDVLATLDPEPFAHAVDRARSQVDAARASLAQARAELEDATATRDRTARLVERGVMSTSEADAATLDAKVRAAAVQTASATLRQAEATLADAVKDLADTEIRAPIAGVVIQRYVDPGQTVVSSMATTVLFEVASDLSSLEVEVGVDEADVARVAAGQHATFTVSAFADRVFEATVLTVDLAPDPDATVVTYDATLRVDNAEGLLRPGMTATAEIEVQALDDVVQVPTLALGYRPSRDPFGGDKASGTRVYVLRDGEAVAVPVTPLGSDGTRSAVAPSGDVLLAAGDRVVLGGGR